MMDVVHLGSPLSTIADVILQNVSLRNERLDSLPQTKKDWISRLLYAGFLAAECLDSNPECEQICGLCGINPEVVLGESHCNSFLESL